MEKPTTLLESPARVALVRQVGIISLSLAAILSVSSCADNGPIGCRGVDVQTTGTPWVGFDFDYRLPDGEAFETASLNFGDGLAQTAESDILVTHQYPANQTQDYRVQAVIHSTSGDQYACPITTVTPGIDNA